MRKFARIKPSQKFPNLQYIDGTLGHTTHCDDHIVTLRDIFTRIRDAGLSLKQLKRLTGFESILFTGYVVGNGIM